MNLDRRQAKTLSTAKELELFDNARAPKLNKLTVAELKQMVKRSRSLRDKLKDVKRGEIRSAKSSSRPARTAADRTVEKANLYSDVHDTFVKRLDSVEKAATAKTDTKKGAPKKPLASAARKGVGKVSPPKGNKNGRSAKATTASKAAATQPPLAQAGGARPKTKVIGTRLAKGGTPRKHSHVSSLNKRNQGKRDAR